MKNYLAVIVTLIILGSILNPVFGHSTVNVEKYQIEVGWATEPAIVGFRNAITFEINEVESGNIKNGVTNAFKNLQAIAKSGGITKTLDIDSESIPGHYLSNIIPTKIGTIEIDLKGDINGVAVDIAVPLEDVENTALLDFPPATSSSETQDVSALKNELASLEQDVSEIKSKVGGIDTSSGKFNVESAYNFGVVGLSLGAAGVILAIIAMIKRK